MNAITPSTVSLDDTALTLRLTHLLRHERSHIVDFLRHLALFDSRRVYLGLGYGSLFVYLRDGLRLSNGSAYRRSTVARLMNRFPVLADFLEDGRLNLTRVAELSDVLTDENHLDLLHRAMNGSEDDVRVLVASLKPKPDVLDGIRKAPTRPASPAAPTAEKPVDHLAVAQTSSTVELLPAAATSAVASATNSAAELPASVPARANALEVAAGQEDSAFASSTVELGAAARPRRMEVEPTSATAFCVRMRVGPEFLAEFEEVKAALSHKIPDGNFEDIFRECFRVTLEAINRRRAATTQRWGTAAENEHAAAAADPKPTSSEETKSTTRSRYIDAAVRRAVWKRDGGRCAFVSADGRRCDSRHQVEFHHVQSFASGGPTTEANLSLRCRQHNLYEAELEFGAEFMRAKASRQQPSTEKRQPVPPWNSNRANVNSAVQTVPKPDPTKRH